MRKGLSCCLIRPGLPLGHTDLCHTLGLAKENNYGWNPRKDLVSGCWELNRKFRIRSILGPGAEDPPIIQDAPRSGDGGNHFGQNSPQFDDGMPILVDATRKCRINCNETLSPPYRFK